MTATLLSQSSVFATGTGYITILDPCDIPFGLTVQAPVNVVSDYSTPAVFNFPTWIVSPIPCDAEATFTCSYNNGPYTGAIDMCTSGTYTNGNY